MSGFPVSGNCLAGKRPNASRLLVQVLWLWNSDLLPWFSVFRHACCVKFCVFHVLCGAEAGEEARRRLESAPIEVLPPRVAVAKPGTPAVGFGPGAPSDWAALLESKEYAAAIVPPAAPPQTPAKDAPTPLRLAGVIVTPQGGLDPSQPLPSVPRSNKPMKASEILKGAVLLRCCEPASAKPTFAVCSCGLTWCCSVPNTCVLPSSNTRQQSSCVQHAG